MPRISLTWATALIGVLLLASGCATVQTREPVATHRDQNVAVALFDEACADPKVLRFIPTEARGEFRAGDVLWQGKHFSACWIALDGETLIVDETGDSGFIPVKGQKRV